MKWMYWFTRKYNKYFKKFINKRNANIQYCYYMMKKQGPSSIRKKKSINTLNYTIASAYEFKVNVH